MTDDIFRMAGRVAALSVLSIGFAFLVFTALVPLGLTSPTASPSNATIAGSLGRSAPRPSVESLYRTESDSSETDYFERLTRQVANWMVHYWYAGNSYDANADDKFVRVSPLQNYMLWAMSYSPDWELFADYEFSSPSLALERGFGYCSQVSYLIAEILRDQGYAPTLLMHPNHTVVEVDGNILDADFGVFLPHSALWLQTHPEAISKAYGPAATTVAPVYADGWRRRDDREEFAKFRGLEEGLQLLKWFPPVLLLVVGALSFDAIRERRRRTRGGFVRSVWVVVATAFFAALRLIGFTHSAALEARNPAKRAADESYGDCPPAYRPQGSS